MDKSVKIFFSYAQTDAPFHDDLMKHLSILKNEGVATTWSDREIQAGSAWQQDIARHLNTADLILLLISADFLASAQHYDGEMKQALERHAAGQTHVVPILLRAVDWKGAPFGSLRVLPSDGSPIGSRSNRDEAFFDIAKNIRDLVEEILIERGQHYLSEGKYAQASEVYKSVLKLQPAMISAHRGRGNALFELKKYDEALASYNKALEIDPQDASGHVDKGYTLLRLHRYQDALTAYQEALRLEPHAASAYGEKGKALDELKKFKGDIVTIVEQLLPSILQPQQNLTYNSLAPMVKIAPSLGTPVMVYTQHKMGVVSVDWLSSPKNCIASLGLLREEDSYGNAQYFDGIDIWKATTGTLLCREQYPAAGTRQLVCSPTDQYIATRHRNGVGVTDYKSPLSSEGKKPSFLAGKKDARSVTWSPEGLRIASTIFQEYDTYEKRLNVEIWEAKTGNRLDTYQGAIGAIWSPVNNYIMSSKSSFKDGSLQEASIVVWETGSHRIIANYDLPSLSQVMLVWSWNGAGDAGARDSIHPSLFAGKTLFLSGAMPQWSPDGQYIASPSNEGISIWRLKDGHTVLFYGKHGIHVNYIKWSPDGKYLASASNKDIHVWDTETGDTLLLYKGHSEDVICLCWSPDNTRIASGSRDGSIQVWVAIQ